MIIAKQVLKNQYWILRDSDGKVGNIEATGSGFRVKINDNVQEFKTIRMVKQRLGFDFETPPRLPAQDQYTVHGYSTGCRAYNAIYEVRQHLPLFTKTAKSKSWYCAGWLVAGRHSHRRHPRLRCPLPRRSCPMPMPCRGGRWPTGPGPTTVIHCSTL